MPLKNYLVFFRKSVEKLLKRVYFVTAVTVCDKSVASVSCAFQHSVCSLDESGKPICDCDVGYLLAAERLLIMHFLVLV